LLSFVNHKEQYRLRQWGEERELLGKLSQPQNLLEDFMDHGAAFGKKNFPNL
jgi:hypothetical protein